MRARSALVLFVAGVAAAAGCTSGGNFTFLGYTTEPPFDPDIRSVYLPVFKNIAFHTNPHRGIEVDLTEAIVRELANRKSPIRVVSDPDRADTELVGTIVSLSKNIMNRDRANYSRETELVLTVEVIWRDLRSGRGLNERGNLPTPPPEPFDPSLPTAPPPPPKATLTPVRVVTTGRFLPELGESSTTGQQKAVNEMARKIVDLMEKPWGKCNP